MGDMGMNGKQRKWAGVKENDSLDVQIIEKTEFNNLSKLMVEVIRIKLFESRSEF